MSMHDHSDAANAKSTRLYDILGIDKKATEDDIKKAYRRLALQYHPDKNLDGDPAKTEKFKEINYANGILSDPKKRKVYDEMGETGLKLMEQFGEDEAILTWVLKPWFKWVFYGCGIITCGFFCCCCGCLCCCKCCCNFCCGKYQPAPHEEYMPDDLTPESDGEPPVMAQPGSSAFAMPPPPSENKTHLHEHSDETRIQIPDDKEVVRPAVIAMPPPSSYGSVE